MTISLMQAILLGLFFAVLLNAAFHTLPGLSCLTL